MDESSSDSEMDDVQMSGAPIDVLMVEIHERRKRAARAFMRKAFKVTLISNKFEDWLRLVYDHVLFKPGGRGALVVYKHFYFHAALQNA
eukprot:188870-Prymnesium_polylepis.1